MCPLSNDIEATPYFINLIACVCQRQTSRFQLIFRKLRAQIPTVSNLEFHYLIFKYLDTNPI